MTFSDFGFHEQIIQGIQSMGYEKPTAIQEQAIPTFLSGCDVIACAQTGTGKTAAYLLPVLHKMIFAGHRHLNTLIIAPTRELVQQIDQQIEGLAYFTGISSIAIYGGGDGQTWEQQKRALEKGADMVVATPGRLLALLAAGTTVFDHLEHLILDEADRMLDMSFFDDIIKIVSHRPAQRQTLLFSATMPPKIRNLAHRILHNPVEVNIAIAKPAEGITQQAYLVFDRQKDQLLTHLLQSHTWKSLILFASTKETVKQLARRFAQVGMDVKPFHSDLSQVEREEIIRAFRNRQIPVLIGTDVLSRGIDVEGISMVINWDVPSDPEDYVHRIGRTARAESTGTAITFINEKDLKKFQRIEKLIGTSIPVLPLPDFLGEGPSRTMPTVGTKRSRKKTKGTPRRHPKHSRSR
ncbi:MAG: DEAD/DEAH box helicase [Cyclobacteriaceae bacterium]|nr:DEAD/DEAH box helicase [Cyclobacteriaceae bacterium]